MPLEATMLVVDNSEYMRNGDYTPTRFDAMADAINIVFQTKIDANPENTVGLISMAAKSPELIVTQTKEIGHIINATHSASNSISGSIDIPTSIAIALLALKHRENKNLRQRIIVFVASPLDGPAADEKNMVKLAKKLKKNNVAVDVVCFGDGIEEGENSVLKAFVDAASSSDNSHYISVPPGSMLISDVLISSPILAADRGIPDSEMADAGLATTSAATAGGGDFDVFNVDPSLDPELAMALRMSMQEARQREDAEQASATAASTATAIPPQPLPDSTPVPAPPTADEQVPLLQPSSATAEADVHMANADDDEEMDEEEAIARAIEMSMAEEQQHKQQ